MKTKEELNALKEEVETLNKKLAELSEEELKQISGGGYERFCVRVSANSTTCIIIEQRGKSNYIAMDPSKPQSCGNCCYFGEGYCLVSTCY